MAVAHQSEQTLEIGWAVVEELTLSQSTYPLFNARYWDRRSLPVLYSVYLHHNLHLKCLRCVKPYAMHSTCQIRDWRTAMTSIQLLTTKSFCTDAVPIPSVNSHYFSTRPGVLVLCQWLKTSIYWLTADSSLDWQAVQRKCGCTLCVSVLRQWLKTLIYLLTVDSAEYVPRLTSCAPSSINSCVMSSSPMNCWNPTKCRTLCPILNHVRMHSNTMPIGK